MSRPEAALVMVEIVGLMAVELGLALAGWHAWRWLQAKVGLRRIIAEAEIATAIAALQERFDDGLDIFDDEPGDDTMAVAHAVQERNVRDRIQASLDEIQVRRGWTELDERAAFLAYLEDAS